MSSRFEGPGGSPGGLGEFLVGFALAAAGGYLLSQQVTVTSGYWHLWGHNAFGLTLIPLLLGVAILFFDGRSKAGWLLLIAGAVFLLAGILMNLEIYFRSTSLFNTLLMLVLLFGGLGLLARSFRSHRS
jgi:uncharacterized membrane protein HdeD (DUF308 family)